MRLIYGVHPVLEAIKQDGRQIREIAATAGRGGAAMREILKMASEQAVPVAFRDRTFLDDLAGSKNHQGIVALCDDYAYAEIDDLIADAPPEKGNVLLVLDEVTDARNLGALIRTAHCLGVKGVIIPGRRTATVTAAVIKTSAGAADFIPVARVVNLSRTMDYLKEKGFWIYGADPAGGLDIREFDDNGPVALVMGSEGKGMGRLIRDKCDFLLRIPMSGEISSLNVSVAAGIILYEMLKRRDRR